MGKDSMPNLGLGRVNSICDGTTFIEIWPFSSKRCHTWYRFRQRAFQNKLNVTFMGTDTFFQAEHALYTPGLDENRGSSDFVRTRHLDML